MVEYSRGYLAMAHNGNLTNAKIVKDELQNYGSIFQSSSDTEVKIHLMALPMRSSTVERLISALRRMEGSYSIVALTNNELIARCATPTVSGPCGLGKMRDGYALYERRTAPSTSSAPGTSV
jgi:amidophosphoribosyltransferase